ncbi:UNVERIFIED_CONTAM: hypothetical protein Slati_4484900 [Sesamum latifolium]|uniref:Uncharacterized protein n=1 Tax=Sesamum latifolium TaxID=2727402 RepID=A0AAW2SSH1_9LAMI
MEQRISGWSHNNLSFAARTHLIESGMSVMCMYSRTAFVLPKGVIRITREEVEDILWRGNTGSGYGKVPWGQICQPVNKGGLSIIDAGAINLALMSRRQREWSATRTAEVSATLEHPPLIQVDFNGHVHTGNKENYGQPNVGWENTW